MHYLPNIEDGQNTYLRCCNLHFFQGRFIGEEQFGGYMFWSVDMDDFEGKFCKKDKYIKNPLQKAIIEGIQTALPKSSTARSA